MDLSLPTSFPPEHSTDDLIRAHKFANQYFITKDSSAGRTAIILCGGRENEYPETEAK